MQGKDDIKKVNGLEPVNSASANLDTSTHSAPIQPSVARSGLRLIRPEDMEEYMKKSSPRFFSGVVTDALESDSDSFSSDESSQPYPNEHKNF